MYIVETKENDGKIHKSVPIATLEDAEFFAQCAAILYGPGVRVKIVKEETHNADAKYVKYEES